MRNSLRLKNFPISFFAPILGLAGFSLALQRSQSLLYLPNWVMTTMVTFTIILFVIILGFYGMKFILFRNEVITEYRHPIKINFFPLISKILLVLSIVFLSLDITTSKWLWIFGVVINTIFSISILGEWISKEHFKIEHMSPSWFIPVVGNLIIPIAGIVHFQPEISWAFFSAGITWMFILTTIIIYRLIFHGRIIEKLVPTFFILFAAPAIAFIAYNKLTNGFDAFAHILYYFATFLFILIASQWKLFTKIKFYLSWWAYTFPLAAYSLATILMLHITGIYLFKILAITIIMILAIFILALSYLTLKAISKKQICLED